jgi:hypothetical protein
VTPIRTLPGPPRLTLAGIITDRLSGAVPKAAALVLSIACVAGAAVFGVAGLFWIAVPLFVVSVVFDVLFVLALRAEKQQSP